MTKTKFLLMSVVFALTYITGDVFFIFYIAEKTEQPASTPANDMTSRKPRLGRADYAFANTSNQLHKIQVEDSKAKIIVE